MDYRPYHLHHLFQTLRSPSLIDQAHPIRIRIDAVDVERCHHISSICYCHNKRLIPKRRQKINQAVQPIHCDVDRFQLHPALGKQSLVLVNHASFHRHTEDGPSFVIPVFLSDYAVIVDVAILL